MVLLSIKSSKCVTLFSFYRVIPAGIPGVAAKNPPDAHDRPLDWAVALYGGDGIFRTGGVKPATGGCKGGDEYLVDSHQDHQNFPENF